MKRMHNNCGEIFSGFCRKSVGISELVWTMCFEINDFKAHSFPIFQRSSWEWERAWGRWHGWGRTEGGAEGVGHISVKIILTLIVLATYFQASIKCCKAQKCLYLTLSIQCHMQLKLLVSLTAVYTVDVNKRYVKLKF